MNKYDLAIIGAGPVGLFASTFAQLHGLKTVTFEALNEVGGQVEMLFPNKQIKDIPAYPTIMGKDLIKNLKKASHSKIINNTKIVSLEKQDNLFKLNSDYYAKTILLTTGLGAFHPKKLPLKIESKRINYFMRDPAAYENQTVAVLGGGDSALDWAMQLSSHVKKLYLIHRRDNFRGLESNLNLLQNTKNVEILTPYLPKKATEKDESIEMQFNKLGEDKNLILNLDQVFVAYGYKSDSRLLRKWGLDISPEGVKVSTNMATSIPGIYAAGDNTDYPGRVPMIGLGFGEAQIAISNIMTQLFPEKKITLHSTSI